MKAWQVEYDAAPQGGGGEEFDPMPGEVVRVGATGSKFSRHSDADCPRMLQGIPENPHR